MSLMVPSVLSQDNSPHTNEEKRQILGQLIELRSCREQVRTYDEFVSRDADQDKAEKANAERALELEKKATELAERERDLALEKAKLYEGLYRSIQKGPGWGCRLKRIFSFGLARCQ